ncbi:MAG: cell division protein FtsA [Hyphomicrobium sp.]
MADRRTHSRIQGLLDIGSGTVTAAVAVIEPSAVEGLSSPRIAGLGSHRSRGVKAGVLIDLDEAEHAVRAAIGQAERAAGVTIDGVVAAVACGRLGSRHFAANAHTEAGVVTNDDLIRVQAAGQSYAERDGRALVHLNRLGFRIDGAAGVRDPRGLAARQVAVQFHAVTMDEAPLRNLLVLIDRCNLNCDGLVAAPYASGLAATTAEERELGVVCIDVGAGTTSLAMFADGRFVGADVVPVGSQHITFDIAKTLQTPLAEAERIKTLYGTLIVAQSDDYETISYPIAGEESSAGSDTTRARLSEIIRPRMAQIVALARERMTANEAAALSAGKFVLTGGASQLIGAADFVANEFGRPGRLGRPGPMRGLTAAASTPQLSTLAGLALAATNRDADFSSPLGASPSRGYLGRVGSWLKAGF